MNVTLSAKVEALLRRATDEGASVEEQRTAAHIAAKLIMREAATPSAPPPSAVVDLSEVFRNVERYKRERDLEDLFRPNYTQVCVDCGIAGMGAPCPVCAARRKKR